MSKASIRFKERLTRIFENGLIKKVELHKKTGLSLSAIHNYLKGAVPDLNSLDKIADALNCDPIELIKPENEPIFRPHSIEDCLRVVSNAVTKREDDQNLLVAFKPTPPLIPPDLLSKLSKMNEKSRNKLFKAWRISLDAAIENEDEKSDSSETG